MNPLRIFARLRRLEASSQVHNLSIDGIAAGLQEAYPSIRPIVRAIAERLGEIEKRMTTCARCRAWIRVDQINEEHGPRLMEKGRSVNGSAKPTRIVVCEWCELGVRRLGWTLVKIASPPAPAEPPQETEASA